jgi:hypothetical protein
VRAAAAVALLLCAAATLGPVAPAIAQYDSPQQEEPAQSAAPEQQQEEDSGGGGDDPSGPPIWAGLGLMLVAAVAGTLAARARNRRRMRDYSRD